MRKAYSYLVIAVALVFVTSCGGGGAATQFDEQILNDNSTKIQSDVDDAELIIVGTITALGTAPDMWSGIVWSTQGVTYNVDSVLKGSLADASITVYHLVVDDTRQSSDAPGLDSTIFAVGNKLIVTIKQNPNLVNLGTGWEIPRYIDFDENFSSIPWSQQNENVIKNMISNPSAMIVDDLDSDLVVDPMPTDKTLTVNGSEADVQSFNNLLDQCKGKSKTLSDLVSMIQNSDQWTVTINVQRDADNVFVDSFSGRVVDIDDLEKWGAGCNDRTDVCQLFGHFLQEYWHAEVTGDGYEKSHETALQHENQIRSDLGKTTTLTGHSGVRMGGDLYCSTTYDGSTELIKITGGNKPAPGDVTIQVTPPAAPAGVGADNSTSCQITISWTDNSDNEDGFEVERRESGSEIWETVIDSVPANATSWTNAAAEDATLAPGVEYCYRVRAFRISGETKFYSDYSDEACATKQ